MQYPIFFFYCPGWVANTDTAGKNLRNGFKCVSALANSLGNLKLKIIGEFFLLDRLKYFKAIENC